MALSVAQFEQAAKSGVNAREELQNTVVDMQFWWDIDKVDDATDDTARIEKQSILKMYFDENMFSTMPTLTIIFKDIGTYLFSEELKIGRQLLVIIEPKAKDDFFKDVEPLVIKAKIERFHAKFDITTGAAYYVTDFILTASAFINNIISYPSSITGNPVTGYGENSGSAISTVAGKAGIPTIVDVKPLDKMTWINNNLTCKDFIDKIVNHSWLGTDDATLFYVTLDGKGHYTSIKTLCESQTVKNLMFTSKYADKKKQVPKDLLALQMRNDAMCLAHDVKLINTGSRVQNAGGGIHQAYFYDNGLGILSSLMIALYNDKAENPDPKYASGAEKANYRYVKFDGSADEVYLGGRTNSDTQVMRAVREKSFAGVHFEGTHNFYDIAEANNTAIKVGFFQEFWKITIDMGRQEDYYFETTDNIPKIGDIYNVSFDIPDKDNKIYNGSYLVTRVEHLWTQSNSYVVAITLCADGTYSVPKKCKYFAKCNNCTKCEYKNKFNECEYYKKFREKELLDLKQASEESDFASIKKKNKPTKSKAKNIKKVNEEKESGQSTETKQAVSTTPSTTAKKSKPKKKKTDTKKPANTTVKKKEADSCKSDLQKAEEKSNAVDAAFPYYNPFSNN